MSKIIIRSLPWSVRDDTLNARFASFGEIVESKVIMSRDDPSRSRGFGFVTFRDSSSAVAAVEGMDGTEIEGRRITVALADDPRDRREQGRHSQQNQRPPPLPSSNGYDGLPTFPNRGGQEQSGRRDYYERDRYREQRGRERERERSPGRGRGNERSSRRNVVGGGAEVARDESNTNARIYVSGFPEGTTEEELAEFFGQLGRVARKKQRRGYPDQWPYKISIYLDDAGKQKGDATLTYEDYNAAQSAPEFFNGTEFKGAKLNVELAQSKEKTSFDDSRDANRRSGHGGGRDRYRDYGRDNRGHYGR